eukprot:433509_1
MNRVEPNFTRPNNRNNNPWVRTRTLILLLDYYSLSAFFPLKNVGADSNSSRFICEFEFGTMHYEQTDTYKNTHTSIYHGFNSHVSLWLALPVRHARTQPHTHTWTNQYITNIN